MKLGIVGLPNVGKSTLFNCITKSGAAAANYPFCTIDPNVGVVAVPDERLSFLEKLYNSERVVQAVIELVDIAGLVRGASAGNGLGNKFLSHIREVDAIIHVVRCFDDSNVIHVDDSVNPKRDIETINLELILADLEAIERRLLKEQKNAKSDRTATRNCEILEIVKAVLNNQRRAETIDISGFSEDDMSFYKTLNLLTAKKVLYAANISEEDIAGGVENAYVASVREIAGNDGSGVFVVSAKIEEELSSLPDEEKRAFLAELGCEKSGLDQVIMASYTLLGLISFLTAGPKEARAWTILRGSLAPQAAGKIHSDLERGFIRAEVVAFEDLFRQGSYSSAKDAGLVRSEGKDYEVKDGDVILFRFNV